MERGVASAVGGRMSKVQRLLLASCILSATVIIVWEIRGETASVPFLLFFLFQLLLFVAAP